MDEHAVEAGVPPLSSFGFRDDRDGQKLTWHPVPDGLRTVEALIAATQNLAEEAGLHDDLLRLQRYLKRAEAKGVRFCLIVRVGMDKLISPVEMDNRQGHFL